MKRLFSLAALLLTACGTTVITSYEDCVEAGYPVMESYPPKCSDGEQVFVQNIGNALEKQDLIRLTSPQPGENITMPLRITGEARGQWYFEANFPVTLRLPNNEEIITYATAEGEWMTTDFVPFTATIDTELPRNGQALLILRKANASGLPENDDALIIPLRY